MRPANTVDRPDLGALAYEYLLSGAGYIGTDLMPIFPVAEQSMQYPVITLEAVLKARSNTRRASRSGYPRADWEFETQTFACAEHGWEEVIDDNERALYARFFDAEAVATEIATGILLRNHETRVAAVLAALAGNSAASAAWSNAATATPKADVQGGINAMRAATGVLPNVIAMSYSLFQECLVTAEIKDYLQYTSPHLVQGMEAQRGMLASYFGVSQVLVGDVLEDTGKRGKAASLSDVWPTDEVYLARVATDANLRQPAIGRTFMWTADAPNILTTESYRDEPIRSDVIRVRHNVAEAVQYAGAGHRVTGV